MWKYIAIGWMPKPKSNAQIRKERDDYAHQINDIWGPSLMKAAARATAFSTALHDIGRMDDVTAIHRRVEAVFDLVYKRDTKETP